MSKFNSTLTAERLREVLDYEPETGVFRWRIARRNVRVTDTPGSIIRSTGYWCIQVDGVKYLAHRIAWLWVYGVWPDHHIDHIDGNPLNNRISNLRQSSVSLNMQNLKTAQSNNLSSGLLGVYRNRKRWGAKITVNRVVHLLGTHDTPEEAYAAYLGAKRLLHPGNTL